MMVCGCPGQDCQVPREIRKMKNKALILLLLITGAPVFAQAVDTSDKAEIAVLKKVIALQEARLNALEKRLIPQILHVCRNLHRIDVLTALESIAALRIVLFARKRSNFVSTNGGSRKNEGSTEINEELLSVEAASGASVGQRIAFGESRGQRVRRLGFRRDGDRM